MATSESVIDAQAEVEHRQDTADDIVSADTDESLERMAPAVSSASTTTARATNAADLDRLDVEYGDTQSIGLDDSGGFLWICNAFVLYGRQMDASSSGLMLLLGHGLQFIWALNTMRRHHDRQEQLTVLGKMAILIYYVGAIAGTLAASALLVIVKKRTFYVRW